MYWNKINNSCYEFTKRYHVVPETIQMNEELYRNLLNEMYGNQKLVLIKTNSVRGLKIIIKELNQEFVISSTINKMKVKY